MRARIGLATATVLALLLSLPSAGANLTNPTSNDGNSFTSLDDFNLNPSFRVVTYEISGSAFSGTTYLLTLNQTLSADYFVMLRGAAGD